jgi:hypothetical protein
MKLFGNVLLRIVATFVASALGVIGAGAIGGVPPVLAATMGGILAVAKVIELLSLAFLEDGKLSQDEINAAFQQTVKLKNIDNPEAAVKQLAEGPLDLPIDHPYEAVSGYVPDPDFEHPDTEEHVKV